MNRAKLNLHASQKTFKDTSETGSNPKHQYSPKRRVSRQRTLLGKHAVERREVETSTTELQVEANILLSNQPQKSERSPTASKTLQSTKPKHLKKESAASRYSGDNPYDQTVRANDGKTDLEAGSDGQ